MRGLTTTERRGTMGRPKRGHSIHQGTRCGNGEVTRTLRGRLAPASEGHERAGLRESRAVGSSFLAKPTARLPLRRRLATESSPHRNRTFAKGSRRLLAASLSGIKLRVLSVFIGIPLTAKVACAPPRVSLCLGVGPTPLTRSIASGRRTATPPAPLYFSVNDDRFLIVVTKIGSFDDEVFFTA